MSLRIQPAMASSVSMASPAFGHAPVTRALAFQPDQDTVHFGARKPSKRGVVGALTAAFASAILLAGCGGGGAASQSPSSPSSPSSPPSSSTSSAPATTAPPADVPCAVTGPDITPAAGHVNNLKDGNEVLNLLIRSHFYFINQVPIATFQEAVKNMEFSGLETEPRLNVKNGLALAIYNDPKDVKLQVENGVGLMIGGPGNTRFELKGQDAFFVINNLQSTGVDTFDFSNACDSTLVILPGPDNGKQDVLRLGGSESDWTHKVDKDGFIVYTNTHDGNVVKYQAVPAHGSAAAPRFNPTVEYAG